MNECIDLFTNENHQQNILLPNKYGNLELFFMAQTNSDIDLGNVMIMNVYGKFYI